ncbi:MAG: NAD(P)H-hydrate dehydratase [Candidatus Levybacteria bacterium]|nr:NAD(P)H-hydrate dehydratase [Candidatus Levybacteria bacterium]
MQEFDPQVLRQLYKPSSDSHKSQNGKVMLIAGSKLFHAASIWPLTTISRIVDMVFYASTSENNEIVTRMKEQFLNGIVIPRDKIDDYISESDCILIGPGMPRENGYQEGDDDTKILTESLLTKYKDKKWVVDGGSLQTISPEILPPTAIVTPHKGEFLKLFGTEATEVSVPEMAEKYNVVILSKGEVDIVSSPTETVVVTGGNAGMTKGGTGDVLAGLVASLYAKNDAYLSACAASYINKKAGESLFERVGLYFNASDLADEIPKVMKEITTR